MPTWVLVNLSKSWGGGENWTLTATLILQKNNHQVNVIAYPDSPLSNHLHKKKIPHFLIKARSISLFNPFKLIKTIIFLKKQPPDIIILNSSHELVFLGLIAKICGVPHIVFRRGIPQPLKTHLLNKLYLKYIVTRLIVNSQATLEVVTRNLSNEIINLNPSVIYNGIDYNQWNKINFTTPNSALVIGVAGRLSYEKGIDRALLIFEYIIKNSDINVELWIMGEGEEKEVLINLAKDLNIASFVKFIGFSNNPIDIMSRWSILIFPSRWEGFGFVLIESMCLGIPPVAFDIGANSEIINNGKTGFIVEDGNIAKAGELIIVLLKNDHLRSEFAENGRVHVINNFSIDAMVNKLELLLDDDSAI
ncbi:MAG: glycosyltransferase [SAR324 cluster bacterium]|nr:glycosyltransferase [SAR324 cluster bacterium]